MLATFLASSLLILLHLGGWPVCWASWLPPWHAAFAVNAAKPNLTMRRTCSRSLQWSLGSPHEERPGSPEIEHSAQQSAAPFGQACPQLWTVLLSGVTRDCKNGTSLLGLPTLGSSWTRCITLEVRVASESAHEARFVLLHITIILGWSL
eukprot:symbB.v1.2.033833.t1/scaffold4258.1/size42288/5